MSDNEPSDWEREAVELLRARKARKKQLPSEDQFLDRYDAAHAPPEPELPEAWKTVLDCARSIGACLDDFVGVEHAAECERLIRLGMAAETVEAALKQAIQMADVVADWALDEVEIDGQMVATCYLRDAWKQALPAVEEQT